MRRAFKRWLILHNEEWRAKVRVRIPSWFCYYIRQNTDWKYTVIDEDSDIYCNRHELDCNARRRFKGYYTFKISDEQLLSLQRPEWKERN